MVLTGYVIFVSLAIESWVAFYLSTAHERRVRKLVSIPHPRDTQHERRSMQMSFCSALLQKLDSTE